MAKIQQDTGEVKIKRTKKVKKPKPPSDLRSMYRARLRELDIEKIKKPWMAEKAFKLLDTEEALQAWVNNLLADTSRHCTYGKETSPALAVDTEGNGLDTRILIDMQEQPDGSYELTYEVKVEIAGVCLSADGVEGIYVPINHERGKNIPREAARRILQYLFDRCHLIFYNAKFDREVIRLCLGVNLRPYPHFEDVQSLAYINDPKADLGDKKQKYTGSAGGLKGISKTVLGIEQIEIEEIAVVKATVCPLTKKPLCTCSEEEIKALSQQDKKHGKKNVYAPFTWVPTDVALWYAAGDAICTWLLWQKMKDLARSRRLPHRIDHELVDSIIFVERQRFLIDTERHGRTAKWHQGLLDRLYNKLRDMALEAGFKEPADEEGKVNEDDKFNPGSGPQLQKLLYGVKGYKVEHYTKKAGNPSCDADAIEDLLKDHPDDEFLKTLVEFKKYGALHPANLRYDPKDLSARIHLRQSTVAGGRLSASGGDFEEDGGFGMNPQGVKKVEPEKQWRVHGNVLSPDEIPVDEIEEYTENDLDPSCFHLEKGVIKKAKGIIKNHIGQYTGYAICLVPKCTSCAEKHGILIKDTQMDANEVVNLRVLMCSPRGWTWFSVDYSNIEMRAAANMSGEPKFIDEFLKGKGDFHTLTASNVFPEFNDPNTSADKKKGFRDIAKIINFALLYGGTEHAIYLNMREKDPNITKEDCKKMVDKYWEGVPKFAEFVAMKQAKARTDMICETTTGRVINFNSALEALHLHKPFDEERQNLYEYYGNNREAEQAKKAGNDADYQKYKGRADRLWKDPDSGVRNAMEYNKFIGKVTRIAVNAPIQGICGDFMRIALNRLRKWVESDPLIQSVFRLHTSVHDEVDFSVKNEYVPFILPRVTRLMKLRKYHEQMKWQVPIECDAEYGHSWDVDWNATDPKKAYAWTHVEGMERYLPDLFDPKSVKAMLNSLTSGDPAKVGRVKTWMIENLHPRAIGRVHDTDVYETINALDKAKSPKETQRILIAILQLHEYWTIDHVPDGQDATMETLEQYEQRVGLTAKDRGMMPSFGYSGAIPLDAKVIRPTLLILGEEVQAELPLITVGENEITATIPATVDQAAIAEVAHRMNEETLREMEADRAAKDQIMAAQQARVPEQLQEVLKELYEFEPVFELIDEVQTNVELRRQLKEALGKGPNTLRIKIGGNTVTVTGKKLDYVPKEFLKTREEVHAS
jgi:DNA polymerase I-like protein with 3'-5' exonuclease and polymerase domains